MSSDNISYNYPTIEKITVNIIEHISNDNTVIDNIPNNIPCGIFGQYYMKK